MIPRFLIAELHKRGLLTCTESSAQLNIFRQIKSVKSARSPETTDLHRNVTGLRRKKPKSGCNSGGSLLVSAFLEGLQCGVIKISLFMLFHVKEPL